MLLSGWSELYSLIGWLKPLPCMTSIQFSQIIGRWVLSYSLSAVQNASDEQRSVCGAAVETHTVHRLVRHGLVRVLQQVRKSGATVEGRCGDSITVCIVILKKLIFPVKPTMAGFHRFVKKL